MNAEQAKFLVEYISGLWQGELPATVKVLANVPRDRCEYRPDPKSRNGWELATHLALGDVWFLQSIMDGSFHFDPDAEKAMAAKFETGADLASFYEKQVTARLGEMKSLPADRMTRVVDFFGMMQQPAVWFLGFANNHSIHHRGQLASYLRAMGSKVPAIYGASADEPMAT